MKGAQFELNAVAISNKLFMFSLILLMLVLIYHGFGWKRMLISRKITDFKKAGDGSNSFRQHTEDAKEEMRKDDSRLFTVLRNPLLYVALTGIAVSIVITL